MRDVFKSELNKVGIEANIYYKKPIHLQKVMNQPNIVFKNNHLENTEVLSSKVLSLPFFAFPLIKELKYLKTNIFKAVKNLNKK